VSSFQDEQLDKLIAQNIRQRMDDAGEPRGDLLWTKIQQEVQRKERPPRLDLGRFRFSKWQYVSVGAMVACLALALIVYPGALTEIGKRTFLDTQNVKQSEDSGVGIANRESWKVSVAGKDLAKEESAPSPATRKLPSLGLGGGRPTGEADPDSVQVTMIPDGEQHPSASLEFIQEKGSFTLHRAADITELRQLAPFPVLYPAVVPEGFVPTSLSYLAYDDETGETMITLVKEGSPNHIDLTQRNLVIELPSVQYDDSPETTREIMRIGGNEATLTVTRVEDGKYSNLRWVEDGISYWVSGLISPEEIKRMVESLEP
jgi:hypothetical protein